MSIARTQGVALSGVRGHVVEVEAHIGNGLPGLLIIGLPDAALHEARDRVRAAVINSGFTWPDRKITLGLSPASLPKSGSGFDLAIAAAILAAAGVVPADAPRRMVLVGELALDGRVRAVPGVLPACLAAGAEGFSSVLLAPANVAEAALVPEITPLAVGDLAELVDVLRGGRPRVVPLPIRPEPVDPLPAPDLAHVGGQAAGRRALEIAAAGGHHLLLTGPPGTGKTMLAERLPGLLPDLEHDEALEVTAVHSVAGLLPAGSPLVVRPPFRQPHHSATVPALVGGGSGLLRPGLASQAHRGVLFLDEAPEFAPSVLDALRQPLESWVVHVSRARASASFPARFTLVLAANPCPCAAAETQECTCPPHRRVGYLARLSGPLLDRVDLRVATRPVTRVDLRDASLTGERSEVVRDRVVAARAGMRARLAGTPWRVNSEVPGAELRSRWPLDGQTSQPLDDAFEIGLVTARGYDRVLRLAWTLADLAGRAAPSKRDVKDAVDLRRGEQA